jgi:hypothetical protein
MVVSQPCSSHYASMHQPRSQQDPHMPKKKGHEGQQTGRPTASPAVVISSHLAAQVAAAYAVVS